MKKALKIILIALALLVALVGGLLAYVKTMLPDVGPAPDLKVEPTQERLERGEYLANHVMLCMDCHATRDWTLFTGPPKPGTAGGGGEAFDQSMGFPGSFISRNITPTGVGDWTDGEIFRAITSGVNKSGQAMFPVMPHHLYGQLDEEDIKSVIVYIRNLTPIHNSLPESKPDFPMNFIINTIPAKPKFSPIPPKSDTVAYGKYLITAAACMECHTRQEKGKVIGEPYAGGFEFRFPEGAVVRSMNITPHTSGIGDWSEERFVQQFKGYSDSVYVPGPVKPGGFQTVMPWGMYAGMERGDLAAIYAYLRTVAPVENAVERFTPPK